MLSVETEPNNMHPVKIARKRGRDTTKELIGKNLKCKRCGCVDAYVCEVEGRYKVRCPECQIEGYLKEYNMKV